MNASLMQIFHVTSRPGFGSNQGSRFRLVILGHSACLALSLAGGVLLSSQQTSKGSCTTFSPKYSVPAVVDARMYREDSRDEKATPWRVEIEIGED